MNGRMAGEQCRLESDISWEYEDPYDSCEVKRPGGLAFPKVVDYSPFTSLWMCLKVSIESTVLCGVFVGLYATFLWWLELDIRMYCLEDWNAVHERIHRTQLITDVIIAMIIIFWPLACIAPLCGWSTTRELSFVYFCVIGGLLDVTDRLFMYIFVNYGKKWKSFVGNMIFLVTSFAISYRFARYLKTSRVVDYNVVVLAIKLSLQVIFGLLVAIPFNLVFLEVYYSSSSIERTILACVLIIVFAIPKLVLIHVSTNMHGICKPGDEIMLAVAYITWTTLCSRLMQAGNKDVKFFIVISMVHGILNVLDKLSLPLKRKILSYICFCCGQRDNRQRTSVNASLFLANQILISIVTEATCIIFCSAVAYTLKYYHEINKSTNKRYDGYQLVKEIVIMCSIGVGIEIMFNVVAVHILTYLYNIPVITVWKSTRKRIIIIHMIQVLFIVLYFSIPINGVLLKDFVDSNSTCLGFFKTV